MDYDQELPEPQDYEVDPDFDDTDLRDYEHLLAPKED
jgi:hypothetical protein